jgi:predicted NUDIX family NTP pyrophosphohydrolase
LREANHSNGVNVSVTDRSQPGSFEEQLGEDLARMQSFEECDKAVVVQLQDFINTVVTTQPGMISRLQLCTASPA